MGPRGRNPVRPHPRGSGTPFSPFLLFFFLSCLCLVSFLPSGQAQETEPFKVAQGPLVFDHGPLFAFIRHAEKPLDNVQDPNLSKKGYERAMALVPFFDFQTNDTLSLDDACTLRGLPPPSTVLAQHKSERFPSLRSSQTARPLAEAAGARVKTFGHLDVEKLTEWVLREYHPFFEEDRKNAERENKGQKKKKEDSKENEKAAPEGKQREVVVVVWEHLAIPHLVQMMLVNWMALSFCTSVVEREEENKCLVPHAQHLCSRKLMKLEEKVLMEPNMAGAYNPLTITEDGFRLPFPSAVLGIREPHAPKATASGGSRDDVDFSVPPFFPHPTDEEVSVEKKKEEKGTLRGAPAGSARPCKGCMPVGVRLGSLELPSWGDAVFDRMWLWDPKSLHVHTLCQELMFGDKMCNASSLVRVEDSLESLGDFVEFSQSASTEGVGEGGVGTSQASNEELGILPGDGSVKDLRANLFIPVCLSDSCGKARRKPSGLEYKASPDSLPNGTDIFNGSIGLASSPVSGSLPRPGSSGTAAEQGLIGQQEGGGGGSGWTETDESPRSLPSPSRWSLLPVILLGLIALEWIFVLRFLACFRRDPQGGGSGPLRIEASGAEGDVDGPAARVAPPRFNSHRENPLGGQGEPGGEGRVVVRPGGFFCLPSQTSTSEEARCSDPFRGSLICPNGSRKAHNPCEATKPGGHSPFGDRLQQAGVSCGGGAWRAPLLAGVREQEGESEAESVGVQW